MTANAWSWTLPASTGTYVNRKPVESVALANGDEIQMGKFRLVFLNRPHDALTPTASHQSAKP